MKRMNLLTGTVAAAALSAMAAKAVSAVDAAEPSSGRQCAAKVIQSAINATPDGGVVELPPDVFIASTRSVEVRDNIFEDNWRNPPKNADPDHRDVRLVNCDDIASGETKP